MKLKVYLLHPDAIIPTYAHHDDSAMDLSSVEEVSISPGQHLAIATGIAIQLPPLTEAQIRPRSGERL